MNSKEILKPCPFCGGEAKRIDIDATKSSVPDAGGSYIACGRCYACSPIMFGEKTGLEESWNRRAISTMDPDAIRREAKSEAVRDFNHYWNIVFGWAEDDGRAIQRLSLHQMRTLCERLESITKAAILGAEPAQDDVWHCTKEDAEKRAASFQSKKPAQDNKGGRDGS